MQASGWNISVDNINNGNYYVLCQAGGGWWGYSWGYTIGSISYMFKRQGTAVLSYGNCYTGGQVVVYLNDVEISKAYGNQNPKETTFDFFKGDILRIDEVNAGIIKLYSLKMS